MQNSISQDIQKAAQELLTAYIRGANIAACLNETLNQFLTRPFRASSVRVIDPEGKNTKFDSAIYTSSARQSENQSIEVNTDAIACGMHVVGNLSPEELRKGYEHIAVIKSSHTSSKIKGIEHPLNNTPLGIIFAIDSDIPVEKIGELMASSNKSFPSSEWPDMVVILKRGTINYGIQFHGEPIKGDFLLPNITNSLATLPPIYVHLLAMDLGLFSLNKMCHLLFGHLQVFSPGTKLPNIDDVLKDVSHLRLTLGTYQYSLKSQLVPVTEELRLKQGILAPFPFRIEDSNGNLLSHLQFIPWQDGGIVRLIGKLPLEGILIFFGNVAAKAKIYRQSDGAISSVLPIQEVHFRKMLVKFQRQSNMKVRAEKPKWIVSKYAEEGTTSPFIARFCLGILRLCDVASFNSNKEHERFDKFYHFVLETLINARTTKKEIIQTLTEHSLKVSQGEIAHLDGHIIRINENIDRKLRKQVEEFLNSAVRIVKDGMQKLLECFHLNIGFLYQKQGAFERGIATLTKTQLELATYLQETRKWSGQLISKRNELHVGWMLPRIEYKETSGSIQTIEPKILGQPVSEFVEYMLDRVCCFVEEILVHGLQTQMPSGFSITEIPVSDRNPDCPERFQIALINGGMPIWKIAYHNSRFEDT